MNTQTLGTTAPERAHNRRRAAAVVLGALLIVGIPLTRLGNETSSRFGWQMFSKGNLTTEYTVVTESGTSYNVEPADYVVLVRSNLAMLEQLPPHLCTVEPGAVTIITRTGDIEAEVSC